MSRENLNTILIVIAIIAVVGITSIVTERIRDSEYKQDFPHEDTFELTVTCDENITTGESAMIDVDFSNVGENDYDLIFHGKIYKLLVDGRSLDSPSDGITCMNFGPGSFGEEYSVTFDEAGTHEVKAVAEFQVRLMSGHEKSYVIEKSIAVTVK